MCSPRNHFTYKKHKSAVAAECSCVLFCLNIPDSRSLGFEQRSAAERGVLGPWLMAGYQPGVKSISIQSAAGKQKPLVRPWDTALGPAASGTCFVIFTIGLAMFTLLKSFQIIKNRKTFKHYCFSALQCAGGGRKKRTLFQREQVECQGRGRQWGHLLPGAGMWRHFVSSDSSTHTYLSAFLLWLTPPSCCPLVPGFHPFLHLPPKLPSLYLHISLYSVCSTLTNYQALRKFFGLLT